MITEIDTKTKRYFLEISLVSSLFATDTEEFKSKFATSDTFVFKSVHTTAPAQLFAID